MSKRILFIGDGFPLGTNAGSLLYRRVLESYGVFNCCYYGIGYKTTLAWPDNFKEMPKQNSSLRIWRMNRLTKYLRRIPLIEQLYYFLSIPIHSRKVKKFARINKIDLIIAVFRADVLAIINKLCKLKEFPILGYISDTVEAEYTDLPIIYRYKKKEYLEAINNAKGIYVAGEAMNDYVKNTFNKETSILRLGYESNFVFGTRNIDKEIRFFFSGSVYARKELEVFIRSLSKFATRHPHLKIELTTATTFAVKTEINNVKIVNMGWRDEKDLIKSMQNAHIGYVPYKFDIQSKTQMSYAFPSKIGFYLSAGLPIFFHGPVYSSVVPFFKKYPCGIHCDSLEIDVIIGNLERILFEKYFYDSCVAAGIEAFNNEFSLSVMKENFNRLIDQF